MRPARRKTRKQKTRKVTVSGTVTASPKRIQTRTGRPMATLTIQAESDQRSSYPLKLVSFDIGALALMTCQYGQRVTATGYTEWRNGYSLVGASII